MQDEIEFRKMRQGEEGVVWDVVNRTFNKFIAPTYSPEGIESFFNYVRPDLISQRAMNSYLILVALFHNNIVGVIEIRNYCHISLLFVDEQYHRKGVARGLLNHALDICRCHNPDISQITVNSSPYALAIYKKWDSSKLHLNKLRMEYTLHRWC